MYLTDIIPLTYFDVRVELTYEDTGPNYDLDRLKKMLQAEKVTYSCCTRCIHILLEDNSIWFHLPEFEQSVIDAVNICRLQEAAPSTHIHTPLPSSAFV